MTQFRNPYPQGPHSPSWRVAGVSRRHLAALEKERTLITSSARRFRPDLPRSTSGALSLRAATGALHVNMPLLTDTIRRRGRSGAPRPSWRVPRASSTRRRGARGMEMFPRLPVRRIDASHDRGLLRERPSRETIETASRSATAGDREKSTEKIALPKSVMEQAYRLPRPGLQLREPGIEDGALLVVEIALAAAPPRASWSSALRQAVFVGPGVRSTARKHCSRPFPK